MAEIRIRSSCLAPDCGGSVVFIPWAIGRGAVAECDHCGATFQLIEGETTLIRPPSRLRLASDTSSASQQ
jgi:hypothetical protein